MTIKEMEKEVESIMEEVNAGRMGAFEGAVAIIELQKTVILKLEAKLKPRKIK